MWRQVRLDSPCPSCPSLWCGSFLGPLLLTWFNFNPTWIRNYMPNKVWDEITYPFLSFNGCTVEVWEWISNFIPHFIMDVITYPYCDKSYSMLVKGATGVSCEGAAGVQWELAVCVMWPGGTGPWRVARLAVCVLYGPVIQGPGHRVLCLTDYPQSSGAMTAGSDHSSRHTS